MANQSKELIIYMAHDRVNGKCYFGSTFQSLDKRRKQHEYYARKNKNKGHFYGALAKRPESFFWIELEKIHTNNRKREEYYLNKYINAPWCYNQKQTADGAGAGIYNCGHNHKTKEKRKKKYKELIENNEHVFQNEHFKRKNSERQKKLMEEKKHNFIGFNGSGLHNAYSNKALWKRYDKLKEIWLYYNRPSAMKFSKYIGIKRSSLERMIKKFKKDLLKI